MATDVVQLKIERAEKHINEMEMCLEACRDKKPYQVAVRDDANTGESVLYVKTAQEISPTLPIIVGDAISNLYSSLDYLACELVTVKECNSGQTAFPISEHVPATANQKARYEGQVRGMREDVKNIIIDMQPYRGRDNNLWTLHKLNNINKHRTLLTVAYGAIIVSPCGKWEPRVALQEGAELLRVPRELPDEDKITLIPLIAINEPEADVVNHPLLTVVRGCLGEVKRVAAVLRPHRRTHVHLSAV